MRISTQAFQTRTLEMIQQKTAETAKTQAQIASCPLYTSDAAHHLLC